MLINNATIITQNILRQTIARGYILIKDDLITDVGSGEYLGDFNDIGEIIDASGYIISPGLINAHVHLGETIYQNFCKTFTDLQSYIEQTNNISTNSTAIENKRQIICDYTLLQHIKSGTTTIAGGRTNESSEILGIRNTSGYMLMQSPKLGKFSKGVEAKFEQFYNATDKSFTHPALFVHSLATVNKEILYAAQYIRKKYPDMVIMAHVAETKEVEIATNKEFSLSSIQVLQKYGLLNAQVLLIHGNNLTREDISSIHNSKAHLIHCLSSNLRVADNTANILLLKQNDIPISIATDGVVTSGTFSVLSEARKCYVYHNQNIKNNAALSSQEIFDMITINPANALGVYNEIGSIEIGKKADLTFFKAPISSITHPIKYLIENKSSNVSSVIISGKKYLWNQKFLTIDEQKITNDYLQVISKVEADVKSADFFTE